MSIATISHYPALLKCVRTTLLEGQSKIEQEKVRTYWQTGKHIHEHILQHNGRAEYGKHVILKLSGDLDISDRVLDRTVQFYKAYSKISSTSTKLSWGHYCALLTVKDEKMRAGLEKAALANGWIVDQLETETRNANWKARMLSDDAEIPELPLPKLGAFWTYRIADSESIKARGPNQFWLDLGFSVFLELDNFKHPNLKSGDIVTSIKSNQGSYALVPCKVGAQFIAPSSGSKGVMNHAPTNDGHQLPAGLLYTYQAYVENVIDGDTLKVSIDLGFDMWTRHKLRLSKIDAFELDTPEGARAKAFVVRELKNEPYITIKSIKDDKYGRYLADVFYGKESKYLNQALLNEKLAVRV